jgi:transposase
MSLLREELANLKAKIQREDIRLGEIERQFWEDGGVCCPCCGVPGFSEAEKRQERRYLRIKQIEKKLALTDPL